jgi:hypothetical protein
MDSLQPSFTPRGSRGLPAPWERVSQHLSAIAARLNEHGITSRLSRLGGTPVLTVEEPAASVGIDPGPGLSIDCTCLWTPAPGTAPEATADTIVTVLAAIRRGAGDGRRPGA